jgi:hypothetical protein
MVRKYYCWQVAPLQSLVSLISALAIECFFRLLSPTIFGNITDQTEKLGDSFLSIDISKSKEEERCIANAS